MFTRNSSGTTITIPLNVVLSRQIASTVASTFASLTGGTISLIRSITSPSSDEPTDIFQWEIRFQSTRRLDTNQAYASAATQLANGIVRLVVDLDRVSNANSNMAIDFNTRLMTALRENARLNDQIVRLTDANERINHLNTMLEVENRNMAISFDEQAEMLFQWQRRNAISQNFTPSAIGNNFRFRFGNEMRSLRATIDFEAEEGEERDQCLICLEQKFLRPIFICGHRYGCLSCSIVFSQQREPICPICRNSNVREVFSRNLNENDIFELEFRPVMERRQLDEVALVNQFLEAEQAEFALEARAEEEANIIAGEQEPERPEEIVLVLDLPLDEAQEFQVQNVGGNLQYDLVSRQVQVGNELGTNQALSLLGRKRRNPLRLRKNGRKVKK